MALPGHGATIPGHALAPESKKELRRGNERQWTYTCTAHIPGVNHRVRLVFVWKHRRDVQPRKVLVTNRLTWEVKRVLYVYRHRWTGTETFHRDGKQELGMGDCQLRNGRGQTRHMYLVMLTYSLLMHELRRVEAKKWAHQRLTTIGQACRAVLDETMRETITWVVEKLDGKTQKLPHVLGYWG